MINNVLCYPPQDSLGDCFVQAGIINTLTEQCAGIILPVLHRDNLVENVSTLFSNNSKVHIAAFTDSIDHTDLNKFIIENRLPCIEQQRLMSVPIGEGNVVPYWDEQLYTLFDIPFSHRYTKFNMPDVREQSKKLYDSIVKSNKYILVAQKFLNPFTEAFLPLPNDEKQVIYLTEELSSNMLFYYDLIKHADEIHCVPSSIFCLVDSLVHQTQAKLFYHDLRANTVMRVNNRFNNRRWAIIQYPKKY